MKNVYRSSFKFGVGAAVLGVTVIASSFFLNESSAREFPDHLKLKVPKDTILGSKEFSNGDVKYAYKSNVKVDDSPSSKVLEESQKNSLNISGERVEKRTKHSRTFSTSDPTKFVTEFIAGDPQYYQDSNGEWWQAEYATTTKEAFDDQTQPSIISQLFLFRQAFADTSTFYPNDNPETTSVDGRVRNLGTTWSTVRDASDGDYASDSETNMQPLGTGYLTTVGYIINRGAFLFDTSAIGDTDTINSGTLSLYVNGTSDEDNDSEAFVSIVTSSPASNTTIVTADFDQFGTTEQHDTGQRKDISGISTGAYLDFTLNATGLGNISKTAITKYGVREGHDLLNSAVQAVNELNSSIDVYSADQTDTTNDPKLVVVHTVTPPAFTPVYEVRKSASQSRASSASLQADSELLVGLLPNKEYIIEGVIFATSTSGVPDIRIGWSFPAGVVADLGFIAGDDSTYLRSELLQTSDTASQRIQLDANDPGIIKISGTVATGSASSTLSFLWSQGALNSTPTTVLRGSYLKAEEIE